MLAGGLLQQAILYSGRFCFLFLEMGLKPGTMHMPGKCSSRATPPACEPCAGAEGHLYVGGIVIAIEMSSVKRGAPLHGRFICLLR